MAEKKYKICAYPGCNEITKETYCEKHKKESRKHIRERNNKYNRYRKEYDPERYYFYKSKEWTKIRYLAISRDMGLCQECLKAGRRTRGTEVHHIIPIKDDWNKRFDLDNLVTLCRECHNKIEPRT